MSGSSVIKPSIKPHCPNFSSGPCAKRPGWSVDVLKSALLGRSHRSSEGKARLKDLIERHRSTLEVPADYKIAIVAGSDTGAIEMAMWSLLGERGVDVLAWENFGGEWLEDIITQLKLPDVRSFKVAYGELPDLEQVDTDRDVIFTWNGTTSGVRIPNHDWIKPDRKGLTFCDATSAVYAYEMDWSKLDVTTWSWQKVLGGEAAHGMLVLSPRALARLANFVPDRPLPKIFRLTKKGSLLEGVFVGETINTPSMLAVEDCLDALKWVEALGGWRETARRSSENLAVIEKWAAQASWVDFLPVRPEIRSRTSICLKIVDPWFTALEEDARKTFVKTMTGLLDKENVAKDIASYVTAPAGLRIWGGATVEAEDLVHLTPWLDWAYAATKQNFV